MDKHEFANNILNDLMSKLNKRKVEKRNFKLTSLENMVDLNNVRKDENKYIEQAKKKVEEKIVLTENDVLKLNEKQIILHPGSIITPLAKEAARRKGINIIISNSN
ncbi:hypothetical protein ABG79_00383 [Caloramator mitchellensis]|uniref:Uncharacterized protein n=1 Tax=Caloramator mitchellensis TaxID=908809 RepID=A0A0R3K231_CALMK|nr:hypothetical protein [Caloramator mitchellensis]KRQ87582.1 hypothetical protein ABG79_00383 [Caloramator mitchellensis]